MRKHYAGFSLLELVMVIVIAGVISVVIAKTLFQAFQSFKVAEQITESDWQGWLALERLADDIHTILSPASVTTMSSTQLIFTDTSNAMVQYQWSGDTLFRNGVALASGLTAFSFGYLNSAGSTTATPSAVRYISISLTAAQGDLATGFSTLVGTRGDI